MIISCNFFSNYFPAERDASKEKNRIRLEVPITVLNIDSVEVGVSRNIMFELKVGEDNLWSALHEIEITANSPSTATQPPTGITVW